MDKQCSDIQNKINEEIERFLKNYISCDKLLLPLNLQDPQCHRKIKIVERKKT